VLNDNQAVSKDLYTKVSKAMETLGYQPNFVAKSLASNRSFNIAITVNDIENPYYGEILKGMKEVAVQFGYMTTIISPNDFENQGKNFVLHLIQRKMDGVLHHMSHENFSEDDFIHMRTKGIALVNDQTNPSGSHIVVDYEAGVQQLVEHFVEKGHRNFGILAWKTPNGHPEESRITHFRKALQTFGLAIPDQNIFSAGNFFDTSQRNGYLAMLDLLDNNKDITAVFTMNDMMAYGAMKACYERDISIPQDISLAGCDDVFLSDCVIPPLTTIYVPKRELGRKSMELVIQRIKNPKLGQNTVVLQTSLIKRSSVGIPKKHLP